MLLCYIKYSDLLAGFTNRGVLEFRRLLVDQCSLSSTNVGHHPARDMLRIRWKELRLHGPVIKYGKMAVGQIH